MTAAPAQDGSLLFAERDRIQRLSRVRELVFGSLVATMSRYPIAYQTAMVGKELGIPTLEPETVKIPESITIGVSYLVGSIFPLIAYFFLPVPQALPVSLLLTFIALVIVGIIKGKLASMNLWMSIIEIVVVGVISAAGGYILGVVVPHLFGY